MSTENVKVLLCCTGSVASIKLPELVERLLKAKGGGGRQFDVKVVLTTKARHFVELQGLWPFPEVQIYTDEDEWSSWSKRGDPVLHIDLVKWADLLLVAPLSANTLAKIANGICDNMLTSAVRAWDVQKPFVFCPAMNTKMWEHPVTAAQLLTLRSWGYTEVPVIAKTLMCGDTGLGAMAEPDDIVRTVVAAVRSIWSHGDGPLGPEHSLPPAGLS